MKQPPNFILAELAIKRDRLMFWDMLWRLDLEQRIDRVGRYLNRTWVSGVN